MSVCEEKKEMSGNPTKCTTEVVLERKSKKKRKRHENGDKLSPAKENTQAEIVQMKAAKPRKSKKKREDIVSAASEDIKVESEQMEIVKPKKTKENHRKEGDNNLSATKEDKQEEIELMDSDKPKKNKKKRESVDCSSTIFKKSKKKKRKLDIEPDAIDRSLVESIQIDTSGVTLLLFYAYVEPEWTVVQHNEAIAWAEESSKIHGISGRLRVAREGFNGTMTGTYQGVRDFCEAMKKWNPSVFGKVDFKLTDNLPDGQNFGGDLKIMRIKELVNYGLDGNQPELKNGGVHLDARAYHELMEKPNTVIVDIRNSYEADIGRFNPPEGGARYIDPKMRVSTEFPKWVDDNRKELEGQTVMMYCTGGIRCERASALLRERGFENPIYQLQGGIDRYLREFKEDGGHWIGKNYTFDKRFSHGADNAAVVSVCSGCKAPWDRYRGKKRCPACGVPLLLCEECLGKEDSTIVCALCSEQGRTPKKRLKKAQNSTSCGVCLEEFKSRNQLFRHLKDTGHADRRSRKQ